MFQVDVLSASRFDVLLSTVVKAQEIRLESSSSDYTMAQIISVYGTQFEGSMVAIQNDIICSCDIVTSSLLGSYM